MESQASKETGLEEGINSHDETSVINDNSKRYSFEITQNEILKYMPDTKKSMN